MHSGPPDGDEPAPTSLWADVPLFDEPISRPRPAQAPRRSAPGLPLPSPPPERSAPGLPLPPPPPEPSASNLPLPSPPPERSASNLPPPAPPGASAAAQPSPWPTPASPPAPEPWPASSAPSPSSATPAWTQRAPAEQRRRLWPVLLAIFLVFDLLVVAGILVAILPGGDGDKADSSSPPGAERPSGTFSPEKEATNSGSPERASLLSPTGMRRALAIVKKKLGPNAQLQSIRVEKESFQAIARDKLVVVKRDGSSDVLPGPPTIVAPFTLDDVDPGAPSRIEQSFTSSGRKLFYTILSGLQYKGGVQWITFAADARNSAFRSDRSGRGICALERRC